MSKRCAKVRSWRVPAGVNILIRRARADYRLPVAIPRDGVTWRTHEPKAADFETCWPVLRRYFGEIRPAAMMISAGLADPRMKIEIEVTARKRL